MVVTLREMTVTSFYKMWICFNKWLKIRVLSKSWVLLKHSENSGWLCQVVLEIPLMNHTAQKLMTSRMLTCLSTSLLLQKHMLCFTISHISSEERKLPWDSTVSKQQRLCILTSTHTGLDTNTIHCIQITVNNF